MLNNNQGEGQDRASHTTRESKSESNGPHLWGDHEAGRKTGHSVREESAQRAVLDGEDRKEQVEHG